jgi:hypothetical protein
LFAIGASIAIRVFIAIFTKIKSFAKARKAVLGDTL